MFSPDDSKLWVFDHTRLWLRGPVEFPREKTKYVFPINLRGWKEDQKTSAISSAGGSEQATPVASGEHICHLMRCSSHRGRVRRNMLILYSERGGRTSMT